MTSHSRRWHSSFIELDSLERPVPVLMLSQGICYDDLDFSMNDCITMLENKIEREREFASVELQFVLVVQFVVICKTSLTLSKWTPTMA
jgi:hypothetical protein